MKIGIFDPYLDDLGGGEKYMMTIAECLSKKHSVTVFWDSEKDIDELVKRFSLDFSKVSFEKNIFARYINFFERFAKTNSFDALIVLSDGSIPFSLFKKLFVHVQQPLPFVRLDAKAKFKVKRVTRFFCNSFFTKSYVDKTYGVTSSVIYPPIEVHAQKQKKENVILTVGRLRVKDIVTSQKGKIVGVLDYKKQSILVGVFRKMIEDGLKDWRFVLAVSVKEEDKEAFDALQKFAHDFPIEFLVNKTNEELWEIYSSAKIYWHATGYGENLEKHPEYAEHFGISTVEAMGAGVVPVVINAGGQREIVDDGKNGFLWNIIEELKEKTIKLIEDSELRDRMGAEASKKAQDFGKKRFCKELESMVR